MSDFNESQYRAGQRPLRLSHLHSARTEILICTVIGLIALLLLLHLRWTWTSDDAVYRDWSAPYGQFGGSLLAFLAMRLSTWTSRVAIEAAIFTVVNHVFLWRVITALALWILVVVPPFLITGDVRKRLWLLPISGLMALSIPGTVWFDAGYIATTVNYLWALSAGVLAALPALLLVQQRPFSPMWYLVAIPGAVFAGSSEIVSVFLFVVYAITLWHLIRGKVFTDRQNAGFQPLRCSTANLFSVAAILFFIVSMVAYHLLSPGNAARGQNADWFGPTFKVLFERSYSSTLRQIFMSGYLIPLIFFGVVTYLNYRRRGFSVFTLLSLIPVAGSLLLRDALVPGTVGTVFQNLFIDGNLLWDTSDPVLPATMFRDNLLAIIALTTLMLTALVSIITAFQGGHRLFVVVGILAAGFASKFIVVNTIGHALSIPFHRTDLYMLFAFMIATLISVSDLLKARDDEIRYAD